MLFKPLLDCKGHQNVSSLLPFSKDFKGASAGSLKALHAMILPEAMLMCKSKVNVRLIDAREAQAGACETSHGTCTE